MVEMLGAPLMATLIGLLGGVILGLAGRLGRFCTLGAIEDLLYGNSNLRARTWLLAIGVALILNFTAMGTGLLQADETFFLGQGWNLSAAVIGGLMFGYGMAIAGNCGLGALVRLGGGDLRAFVIVLVMGVAGYITLSGPLAELRIALFFRDQVPGDIPGLAHAAARFTAIPAGIWGCAAGGMVILAALWPWQGMRLDRKALITGAAVGMAVTSGWLGTQWVAHESFDAVPVVSHSYSAPLGQTILYLMTSSGTASGFGVGSVFGVLLGAVIGSLIKGHFRWEACEDPRELRRQIFGAVIMGSGAVIAAGCSIGQGLSATSLLAYSGPVTLASICVGAAVGLRQLIHGFVPAE